MPNDKHFKFSAVSCSQRGAGSAEQLSFSDSKLKGAIDSEKSSGIFSQNTCAAFSSMLTRNTCVVPCPTVINLTDVTTSLWPCI